MVKIISTVKDNKAFASVEMAGEIAVIAAEIGGALSSAYNQIKEQDKNAAKKFRFLLAELVSNEHSPMWDASKNSGTVCRAAIVREGEKLTGDDIADLLRRGMPKDIVKSLLDEMC